LRRFDMFGSSIGEFADRSSTAKPRLGFLGLGWIGRHRLAAIAEAEVAEIVALADPEAEFVLLASKLAPEARRMETLEELLQVSVDGVVVATPSALHASQTIALLNRGVAVFCQKPLGRNAVEVNSAISAASSADQLLGVDLCYRFTTAMEHLRRVVQSGELGEIFTSELYFHNAFGPQKPWFYDPELAGGGCVIDLGIHLVDAALWILQSSIVRVESRLFYQGRRMKKRENVCEDYARARLDLASGSVIDLACSWHLHAGRDAAIRLAFYGTKGAVAMENRDGSFFDFIAERFTGTMRTLLCAPPDQWGGRAAVDWVRRVALGSRYDPEIERMLKVAQVLDEIYEYAN
jgi:predicted dehydrogenase